jgi:hypothetical protein
MLQLGKKIPTDLLHTDSLGMNLGIQYIKKFSCSREEVTSRENTGLSKRDCMVDATQWEQKRLITLATSTVKDSISKAGKKRSYLMH